MFSIQSIAEEILNSLLHELVQLNEPDKVLKHQHACNLVYDRFAQLRALANTHHFESKAAEIWFFKELKPRITQKSVFHNILYGLYLKWPEDHNEQKRIVQELLDMIHKFYEDIHDLRSYFRSRRTDRDDYFFLRSHYDPIACFNAFDAYNDPSFCTNKDHALGQMLGFQDLERFCLSGEVYDHLFIKVKSANEPLLPWTAKDVDYVEKIYFDAECAPAADKQKCVKAIHEALAPIYGIDLSIDEVYRIFHKICFRKRELTPYIDAGRENLRRRMSLVADNEYVKK